MIILATIGSSGDVNPVIELGRALRARGRRVLLATNEYFREQVAGNGLEFAPLGTREEADRMMRDPRLWHPRRGFRTIVEGGLLPNVGRLYRIIEERRSEVRAVAATSLCLGARAAQDALGIPTATLHLQPSVLRSHVDNGRLGFLTLGPGIPKPVKRAIFWVLDTVYVEGTVGPGLNAFRRSVGLPPVRGIFASHLNSPQLVLGLFPDWFAPLQPDWPRNTHLTGFLLHDSGAAPGAADEASRFLSEGPSPVLVTPGSAATDRIRFFRSSVAACERAGVRAMLVTNHPGQLPQRLPPGMRAFPYLPFGQVLPHCRAVVHHGGIGTTAQCVRAGVPQLIVANAHDQPDNAQRIERLGLGLSVGQRWFGRSRAARTLEALLASGAILERARQFAPRVDQGAADRAAALVESIARG